MTAQCLGRLVREHESWNHSVSEKKETIILACTHYPLQKVTQRFSLKISFSYE